MPHGCVIFDFDGVIADTEGFHLVAYNQAFADLTDRLPRPLAITRDQYFHHYIVFGNREGFAHMLADAGLPYDDALLDSLCQIKDEVFERRLADVAQPLPGVRPLLAFLEKHAIPRGICSGANRSEIDMLLAAFGLQSHFDVIVAIEDVARGKPDPEGYNQTFAALNHRAGGRLSKKMSLAIEDSKGGCAAARAAGLRVVGIASSLTVADLAKCADHALADLSQLSLDELVHWVGV